MSKKPWMPFYVGDFIADTMHLGATETGIYLRLILHCWQHETIPTDDRQLALIAHCDTRLWHQYRDSVLQFFCAVDASTMHHKRVTSELRRCEEISNKRKAAAEQRRSKQSAIAEQKHTHSHTHSQREEKNAAEAAISPSEETDYFRRGKKVLGENAGGLLAKLRSAKGGSISLARAAIETASTKENPKEYIGAIIRGADETNAEVQRVYRW